MTWFYMSFATEEKWLGAIIIETPGDELTALGKAHELGINPGGEVLAARIDPDSPATPVAERYRHRLLGKAELREMDIDAGGEGELERVVT